MNESEHGYTMISFIHSMWYPRIWYTLIKYDDGRVVEFFTAECIASDGRF